jgi:1-acyl-sn-glycerol-3-phosphate acyltransferase
LDPAYVRRHGRGVIGFLHDRYWRVELRGLDQIPQQGRAVLAGVHRGFMPFDGVMALHAIARRHGRFPRFLIHPTLVKFPFLANFITKLGGIPACQENADKVLEEEGLLGVFPEGIRGAFTRYRRAYKLGRFSRDEFVKIALRHRAPIVPFVTLGSAEIFPILGAIRWKWVRRLTEWPFLPVTPTLNLVPLPSKWHTWFLEPLHVEADHGPEAADDPAVVRMLSNEVRRRMEVAIAEMLGRRRSIFWGSIFPPPAASPGESAPGSAKAEPRQRRAGVSMKPTTGKTL